MSLKLSFLRILTAAIAFITVIGERASDAQASAFICTEDKSGIPTTFAQTSSGSVPIFRWVSGYFSQAGYPPRRRCQEVTERMMSFKAQGRLSHLTSGRVKNQPVICAGTSCEASGDNILFTLRPNQNANQILQEIAANRQGTSGPSAQLTGGGETTNSTAIAARRPSNVITHNQDGSVTFDLDRYLNVAPTLEPSNSERPFELPSSQRTGNSPSFPPTTQPNNSQKPLELPSNSGGSRW
ncbi:hypothetical protein Ple7327_4520 [Pleurocapsa sp. PCC 7327]|uniref:COP23 domain-containing protein n=1 Tax=Pleurocapsa sp. PCC 7327 TaxID=118163 RepID=UPI00029FB6E2|nr:COP23 domain-containing protein [Pleurocapsa sp. PCC 7327]AFY79620.1 hypothetical protein Ple7327_4520 [Pleurocapsa sp. PCC 7327]